MILEGAFGPQVLMERMPPDLLVYVDTSLTLRILRRLRRDTRERNRSIVSILNQTWNNMIPGERDFIQPLKQHADVIIRNPIKDLKTVVGRPYNYLIQVMPNGEAQAINKRLEP